MANPIAFMFWRNWNCVKNGGGEKTLPNAEIWEVSIFVKPMFEHFHLSRVPGKSSKNHPVFFLDKISLPTPWLRPWIWPWMEPNGMKIHWTNHYHHVVGPWDVVILKPLRHGVTVDGFRRKKTVHPWADQRWSVAWIDHHEGLKRRKGNLRNFEDFEDDN